MRDAVGLQLRSIKVSLALIIGGVLSTAFIVRLHEAWQLLLSVIVNWIISLPQEGRILIRILSLLPTLMIEDDPVTDHE
jgi:hypothetical protein